MNTLMMACGLALLAVVLALVLKRDCPVIAFLLTLAAGAVLLYHALDDVKDLLSRLRLLFSQGGMGDELYLPVLKTMVIAVTVRIVSALCKDSGQSALAAKIEIIGAATALAMCLPLLEQVLEIIGRWMS